jgi:VIT1/CCC1 family predicted Fe2+/Mn2+ transporter
LDREDDRHRPSWLKSGTEMTVVGLGEAVTTYVIGLLIGPVLR